MTAKFENFLTQPQVKGLADDDTELFTLRKKLLIVGTCIKCTISISQQLTVICQTDKMVLSNRIIMSRVPNKHNI